MAANAPGGVMVMPGPFFANHSQDVIALALRHAMPVIHPFRYYAEQGGLMAYGNDQADNYQRAAEYSDRILKGASPADLAVQAPVRFELVINLKTAKTIGLEVPGRLLQQADSVLEKALGGRRPRPKPTPQRHNSPDRLDHTERPGALQEAISRAEATGDSEAQDGVVAALLERIKHQHRRHREQSEKRQRIHTSPVW
jgi:hypothetical protein